MIRNMSKFASWMPAGFDGQFDWDFLRPACDFQNTKIEPMDFDAVIERRGHKLVFEAKDSGVPIKTGQAITLTSAWKKDGWTIIHLCGKRPESISGMAIYSGWDSPKLGDVGSKPLEPCTAMDVLYTARCWFLRASGRPTISRAEWDNALWLMGYDGAFSVPRAEEATV